jgi:glycosyltransferase involved in cell wall biosynthesis
MSALRILHVAPYYEQAWAYGGIPRLTTTMTRALARRGHHVEVCTTDVCDARSRARSSSASDSRDVDVHTFPNISNRLAYHLQFFTPLGLRSHLKRTASTFDIAHLHACHNLPGVIAAAALTRAGVPYVVSPNGTSRPIERRIAAKRLFALTAGRRMLPEAARVLAVSRSEVSQLLASGVAERAIALIPNPIDSHEFENARDGGQFRAALGIGQRPVVLFLGKLTPRKGIADLVRAFAQLEREAVLVVAGNDMGAGATIDTAVRGLGLERRVCRTGLLTGGERLEALTAANVLVYPSRDEIFGLVPLEALLCGTPVVVCNDSGCGEVIAATGGGLRVPHGNPAALAKAIASILDDQPLWRHRAIIAAAVAKRLFGAETVCEQLEALYYSVLGVTAPARRMPA